ncbi:MAG: biotin/lipoyl-binding protein [Bergeyella sp.]|nr:biotin/lipoyl-binding protein [Bergeyella sp.]
MKEIGLLLVFLFITGCGNKKEPNLIVEGKIEKQHTFVSSKISGKIEKILVEEGQEVKKGDTLIIISVPEVEAKKIQTQGAFIAAEAQYDMAKKGATNEQITQLKAKVSGFKEQLDFAEKSLNRLKNLLKDSLVPQQKYDEVFAKYQAAKTQYIAAVAQFDEASSGARKEQQTMALGQQKRAIGAMREVEVAASERFIKAPEDMSVETLTLKVGELALAGYSLVSGFIEGSSYFRFTIAENNLGKIRKGQEVNVKIPYDKGRVVKSKVVSIKPLGAYANIASAYPDFEQNQSLFEIKVVPVNQKNAENLLVKSTAVIEFN